MLEKDLGIFIIVTNHIGGGVKDGKEILLFADDDIYNLEISKF